MGQEPKKYHVSDDGKVYRVNQDGSFTELGNAENLSATSAVEEQVAQESYTTDSDNSKKKGVTGTQIFLFVLAIVWAIVTLVNHISKTDSENTPPTEDGLIWLKPGEYNPEYLNLE